MKLVDAELAQRAARGDVDAFRTIMRRYNRTLFRTARSILKDDAEAQDTVQEAFLLAFRAIGEFRGHSSLSTWIVRIVVNQAIGQLRKNARRTDVIRLDGDTQKGEDATDVSVNASTPESPESATARGEMRRILEARIDALPDEFRTVFVLRALEEFSVEETAVALDIPEATVSTRYFRAKALLRDLLSREDGFTFNDVFPFAGVLCNRTVRRVMSRLRHCPDPRRHALGFSRISDRALRRDYGS